MNKLNKQTKDNPDKVTKVDDEKVSQVSTTSNVNDSEKKLLSVVEKEKDNKKDPNIVKSQTKVTHKTKGQTNGNRKGKHSNNKHKNNNGKNGKGNNSGNGQSAAKDNTISEKQTGTTTTSNSYQPPSDADKEPQAPKPAGFQQVIEIQDYRKNAVVETGVVNADAYNNQVDSFSDLNDAKPDLRRFKSNSAEVKKLLSIKKKLLMYGPQTVVLPYSSEELEVQFPTHERHFVPLNGSTQYKTTSPFMPQVISIVYSFIYTGGNPEVFNPLRKDIKFVDNSFTSKPLDSNKLYYYAAKVKESNFIMPTVKDADKEINDVLLRSNVKPGLIDSHSPDNLDTKDGDKNYELFEFNHKLNDDLKKTIDSIFKNDIASIRLYNSLMQFIANIVNIVLNDPDYSEFRGLSRNNEELVHFTYDLITTRTFFEILFYCISEVQNRASIINQKVGYVDPGLKHTIASRVTPQIQLRLNQLAEYLTQIPFDQRIVNEAISALNWGTLSDHDVYHEANSIIAPVLALVGNVLDDKEFLKPSFSFREHVASSAIEIKNGGLLSYFLKHLREFLRFSHGYITSESYSETNLPMYPISIDGDNKKVKYKDIFCVSATRMTNSMTNFLESLPYMQHVFEAVDKYFRGSTQFFRLFKAKGLFDGTDFSIRECKPPILGNIGETKIEKYANSVWLRGQHLGSNLSQVQFVTSDLLDDPTFVPSWRIFIQHGDSSSPYQNLISHIVVDKVPSELKYNDEKRIQYFNNSKFMKPEINIDAKLLSVNLHDCTLVPFFPFEEPVMLGFQNGAIAHGEIYKFKTEVNDIGGNVLQFTPVCFEWSAQQTASTYALNQRPSALPLANHPGTKYYFSTYLVPFLKMAFSRASMQNLLFDKKSLLFYPLHWWHFNSPEFYDLGIQPSVMWWVTVAQLFRNKLFNGLDPLARGRSFEDLPALTMCKLGEDS